MAKSLYIGSTNWGKLQKKYNPAQLKYATKLVNGKRYWDETKHIEDFKYSKPQELNIAQQRIKQGTSSPETMKTDTANVNYAKSKGLLGDVADEINGEQKNDMLNKSQELGNEVVNRKNIQDTKKTFTNEQKAPQAPKLADLYSQYQTGQKGELYKTTDLEDRANILRDQIRTEQTLQQKRTDYERSKPVAMGVIAGKTSEIAKQEQEKINSLNQEMTYVTEQLKTKYDMVDNLMKLTQTDYANAVGDYDREFTQNMQVANYINGEKTLQQNKETKERTIALSNLQIITNALKNKGIELDDKQKLTIRKLELQAGLPSGITEQIKTSMDKNDKIIYKDITDTSDGKYMNILTRDAEGSFKLKKIYLGKTESKGTSKRWATGTPNSYKEWDLAGRPGKYEDWAKQGNRKPTQAEEKKTDTANLGKKLQSVAGTDGYVSPRDYAAAKKAWITKGGYTGKDFDERFSAFRNPDQPDNDSYEVEY